MGALGAKEHVQQTTVVVEHPNYPLEGSRELHLGACDVLPIVHHQLQRGGLKVLVFSLILVDPLGRAPRYRKYGDALCAARIGLVSI